MTEQKNQPYSTHFEKLADLAEYVGKELGLTEWVTITQADINTFAKLTGDEQWIHVDVEQAALHSPYKRTVAHGFMIVSMASKFCYETCTVGNIAMGVNYGMNKVRFPSATPSGARVRGRVSLKDYQAIEGGARYVLNIIYELEGSEKPCCVAEFVAQAYID